MKFPIKKQPIAMVMHIQKTSSLIFLDNIEYSNEINTVVSTIKDDTRILKSDTK
ncbi:hypothetical protein BW1_085_00050 [Bacillus mycoides NBRC 101238 = DSM 11821]|nr:hypothetical protein BW1_085_00050 [Bacillus mycoides NBRC 101238 = DSM 11821]